MVDDDNEFVLEARTINTKALLACKTSEEVEALLGYF